MSFPAARGLSLDVDGTLYDLDHFKVNLAIRRPLRLRAWMAMEGARNELRREGARHDDIHRVIEDRVAARMGWGAARAAAEIARMLDEEWPWLLQKVGPFRELTRLLGAAQAAQIPVVLCSDYPVEAKLKALGLHDYPWRAGLDATTFHALKPRPEVFEAAVAALGVAPGEALHVGDSPALDLEGARGVGMMTALVGRHDAPGATWRSPHMNRFCVEAALALAPQPHRSPP